MSKWTSTKVAERLEEAVETLRRLPPVRVRGYFSAWPQIMHDASDKRDWEAHVRHLGPPSAKAISEMEEALDWHQWLTADEKRLIWLRANNVPWKALSWRLRCDRTTAWRLWVCALTKIASGLNTQKAIYS